MHFAALFHLVAKTARFGSRGGSGVGAGDGGRSSLQHKYHVCNVETARSSPSLYLRPSSSS